MTFRETIRTQYQAIVDRAANDLSTVKVPPEGWIVTLRKALGMSGAQLARRLGVTRASVSQSEKKEMLGGVTLRHMQTVAQGMGCRFVYAIVPEEEVSELIRAQAELKARQLVRRASAHMALEDQANSPEQNEAAIKRLSDALVRDMPASFWDEP